jgi:hypothetical protein
MVNSNLKAMGLLQPGTCDSTQAGRRRRFSDSGMGDLVSSDALDVEIGDKSEPDIRRAQLISVSAVFPKQNLLLGHICRTQAQHTHHADGGLARTLTLPKPVPT